MNMDSMHGGKMAGAETAMPQMDHMGHMGHMGHTGHIDQKESATMAGNGSMDMGMAPMEMMMTMVFNNKLPFHLLLSSVEIRYRTDLFIGCMLLFFIGIAYEYMKAFRLRILDPSCCAAPCCSCASSKKPRSTRQRYVTKLEENCASCCDPKTSRGSDVYVTDVDAAIDDEVGFTSDSESAHNPICVHLLDTGLHGVQLVFSYVIMLAVMTYNVWIVFSVVLGCIVGYLACNWPCCKKRQVGKHRNDRQRMLLQKRQQTDCH